MSQQESASMKSLRKVLDSEAREEARLEAKRQEMLAKYKAQREEWGAANEADLRNNFPASLPEFNTLLDGKNDWDEVSQAVTTLMRSVGVVEWKFLQSGNGDAYISPVLSQWGVTREKPFYDFVNTFFEMFPDYGFSVVPDEYNHPALEGSSNVVLSYSHQRGVWFYRTGWGYEVDGYSFGSFDLAFANGVGN